MRHCGILKVGDLAVRHDPELLQNLRDAAKQAVRNLQSLKLIRADQDAEVARLIEELRSAIPTDDENAQEATTA